MSTCPKDPRATIPSRSVRFSPSCLLGSGLRDGDDRNGRPMGGTRSRIRHSGRMIFVPATIWTKARSDERARRRRSCPACFRPVRVRGCKMRGGGRRDGRNRRGALHDRHNGGGGLCTLPPNVAASKASRCQVWMKLGVDRAFGLSWNEQDV